MTTLSINNSWRDSQTARELIYKKEEWQNHSKSLRGRKTFEGFGHLPNEYRESCEQADYWVYSYATPIAWFVDHEELFKPAVKYSVTTSKHQGRIW